MDELIIGCQWAVGDRGVWLSVAGDAVGLFGAPAEELTGHTPTQALGREAGEIWEARFIRALVGEVIFLQETRGTAIWLAALLPAASSGGEPRAAGAAVQVRNPDLDRRETERFLHDRVGQNLTALGLGLDLARMDFERDPAATIQRIGDVQRLLETVMDDVRGYVRKLRM